MFTSMIPCFAIRKQNTLHKQGVQVGYMTMRKSYYCWTDYDSTDHRLYSYCTLCSGVYGILC